MQDFKKMFKIGQKVICVEPIINNEGPEFKEGVIYVIKSIIKCNNCGIELLWFGNNITGIMSKCACNNAIGFNLWWLKASRFRSLYYEFGENVMYKIEREIESEETKSFIQKLLDKYKKY